jgi:hypothetical protein
VARGLAKGEYLVLLHEPSPHFILQDGLTPDRSKAFAVDDAKPATNMSVTVPNAIGQGHAGLVSAQPMEI